MYDFNLYIQNVMFAVLCYEKLRIENANAAMKARSKKSHYISTSIMMSKRQRALQVELMSYFEHRIQFITDSTEELKAISRIRAAKGPESVEWSLASDVCRIQKIVILDSPDYRKSSKPLVEFEINMTEVAKTDIIYYWGLHNSKAFIKYFSGFDFLKHATLPECLNTPELLDAYLIGINHYASLSVDDAMEPMHELMHRCELA